MRTTSLLSVEEDFAQAPERPEAHAASAPLVPVSVTGAGPDSALAIDSRVAPAFRRFLAPVAARRRRGQQGFTLMELMIVVAIIFVILAIAVPNYNKAKMLANETAAIRMIGTVHTAQTQYQSQFGKYAVTLTDLGPPANGQPGPNGADLMPSDLAQGKKSGFVFQMQGTPGGYTLTVTPESYNGTGRRSFFSDQSMIIRENWGAEPATASSKEIK